jgi:peptidylprolyl isomerase
MRSTTPATIAVIAVVATALTGCAKYVPEGQVAPTTAASSAMPSALPSESVVASPSTAPELPAVSLGGVTVTGAPDAEPTVSIKAGAKPATKLLTADVVEGTGAEVSAGATVTAHYVGYGLATGMMFDSSWQRGEPATFPLANVIQGWQDGLVGMKVGGRRVLVIPAAQGYGNTPPDGSGIEAGETLVFVVDMVATQ